MAVMMIKSKNKNRDHGAAGFGGVGGDRHPVQPDVEDDTTEDQASL